MLIVCAIVLVFGHVSPMASKGRVASLCFLRKFVDRMGPGWPLAASFSSVAYNLLIDPCAWCRCGGSSRLAAGHAQTLSEEGQRGGPATTASLACAGRGSRLLLSAFAYTVRPTPVSFCLQALREYTRYGGADETWPRGEPARPRADNSAVAGPRSPAPRAEGGASGRGCAALPSCSCLRWW